MRRPFNLLYCSILLLGLACATSQPVVRVTSDPFNGTTVARYQAKDKHQGARNFFSVVGGSGVQGIEPLLFEATAIRGDDGEIKSASLGFSCSTGVAIGWRYLDCHAVEALVDGNPFPLGPEDYSGDVAGEALLETIHVRASADELRTLAEAHEVTLRVCTTVYQLTPEDQAGLRAILGDTP